MNLKYLLFSFLTHSCLGQSKQTTHQRPEKARHPYLDIAADLDSVTSPLSIPSGEATWSLLDSEQIFRRQAEICSENKPCTDGSCCGKSEDGRQICGYGNVCKNSCISNCGATAMCGKDSYGGNLTCGMNLCCSYSGWCGTTASHCIESDRWGPCQKGFGSCQMIQPPSCPVTGAIKNRRVGYYQASNIQNRECNFVSPLAIDVGEYTHLNFAFASIDPHTFEVVPANPDDDSIIKEFTALKSRKLQTWVAIGGFDFSDDGPTHTTWSDLVSSADNRNAFIESLRKFTTVYGFQGVDIDWEYPGDPDRGGRKEDDARNFAQLVIEMRSKLGREFGISVVLAPDYWYLQWFNAKAMENSVDFFNFMAYDLHGYWDADVSALGSKVRGHTDMREIRNDTLPLWYDKLKPEYINFGLALYGRGYTVADRKCTNLGCAFVGPSKPGRCTAEDGVLSLQEIQQIAESKNIKPKLLEDAMMKQLTWDDQWIGYDDAETRKLKEAAAEAMCFGGTMSWSVDFDPGFCGDCQHDPTYSNPNDPADCDRSARTGHWTEIGCDAYGMTNIYDMTAEKRWQAAEAPNAWEDALAVYKKCDRPQHNLFSQSIANFLHIPEGSRCDNLDPDDNCDTTVNCEAHLTSPDERALTGAASSIVWNALIGVHEMIKNYHATMEAVIELLRGDKELFIEEFSPAAPDYTLLNILLTILPIPFTVASTGFYRGYLTDLPRFLTDSGKLQVDLMQETTNGIISAAFGVAKTLLGEGTKKEVEFNALLNETVVSWAKNADSLIAHLFGGTDDAISQLSTIISGGKFTYGALADGDESARSDPDGGTWPNQTQTFVRQKLGERAFYAFAIPLLWRNTDQIPVIIDGGKDCAQSSEYHLRYVKQDFKTTHVCVDNTNYFLVLTPEIQNCNGFQNHDGDCQGLQFRAPRGLDKLDGDQWGRITVDDLVQGALATLKAKGTNSGTFNFDPQNVTVFDSVWKDGIRAPGVIDIPICGFDEIINNIEKKTGNAFPCN